MIMMMMMMMAIINSFNNNKYLGVGDRRSARNLPPGSKCKLLGLLLRKKGMHRMQFDHLHLELLSLTIDLACLTICHRRLIQNTVLEQECFDL